MTNEPSVEMWGVLPDGFTDDGAEALLDQWLDLLSPPEESSYPYTISTEGQEGAESGEEPNLSDLRDRFRQCKTGMLGGGQEGRGMVFEDLELTVTIYGPRESYPLAPAWELWTDGNQFYPDSAGSPETAARRAEQLVELAKAVHQRTASVFTYADALADPHDPGVHVDRDRVRAGELDRLYWLNVFGPDCVEAVGRDALLEVDAHRSEGLADDSVLLVLGGNPVETDPAAYRRTEERLR